MRLLLPPALLPALLFALLPAQLSAQSAVTVGPLVGYDAGVPWDLNRTPGGVDWCSCDGSGRSAEHVLSTGIALRWPDAIRRGWGLAAAAGALLRAGDFTSNTYVTAPFADPSSGAIITSRAAFDARARTGDLFMEASLSFAPFSRFELHAGTWGAWRMAGSWSLRERYLDAVPAAATGLQPQSLDGEQLAAPRWSDGAFIAARQLLPLSDGAALQLGAGLRLHAGMAADGIVLRAVHLSCSVALLFGSGGSDAPPAVTVPVTVPVPRSTTDAAGRLTASIELYSTGWNGERIPFGMIRPVQQYFRQKSGVTPTLFFARNSALLPDRYRQMTAATRRDFSARSLVGRNPVEIDYQVLNVLGLRLGEQTEGTLTITGSASPDEPSAMALARAEAVQMYLRTVWDIPASHLRVATAASPQGRSPAETRRVDCTAMPPDLLDPLVVEWMVEQYQTTPVGLDPAISAPDGIREWAITISQRGDTVAFYSSRYPERNRELDIRLLLLDTQDGSPVAPLIAELSVTDSARHTAAARDILEFKYASDLYPDVTKVHVRSTRMHTLPGGDLWTTASGPATRALIHEITESAQDGDVLTVASLLPFGDGSLAATQERAQDLQRISNALLTGLGRKRVDIRIDRRPVVASFDATLPEYARFARMVVVTATRDMK